jgi:hypothetical protein
MAVTAPHRSCTTSPLTSSISNRTLPLTPLRLLFSLTAASSVTPVLRPAPPDPVLGSDMPALVAADSEPNITIPCSG